MTNKEIKNLTPEVEMGKKLKFKDKLEMTGKSDFEFKNYKDKKIVLYFYPKDSTPGCTQEGHDFTDMKAKFSRQNAVILGVSRDSLKSHENFKSKQNYKIDLISDPEEKLCRYFGVIQPKSLYGKKFMGVERSTFVIDENQKLILEWRKVKVKGHAEEVLQAIKEL
ncbi:MAG: peroxiredoxin [Bdellovibrionales bacterium]|nr:peroxiredoxin [Bdellovibrionales bacterium]